MGHADVYTDNEGNEFPITFEAYGYTTVHSHVAENGMAAVVGYLTQDSDCSNPREDFDSFGKMICFHDRYTLGDKHTYSEPSDFMQSLACEFDPDLEDKIEALNNDRYQELVDGGASHDAAANTVESEISELISKTVEESGTVMLPLFLYDHSGLTMSVTSFSCQWDSGQVGWIYATGEKIKDEFGNDPTVAVTAATNLLKSEVETFDQYLRNDVYGVSIETFVNIGSLEEPEWEKEEIDSCWGFFGQEYAAGELKDQFEASLEALEALAIQKGAEREAAEEEARLAALAKSYAFEVKENHEPAAGILFYGDKVTVIVHSGDPGGDAGAFAEHMREAIAAWYDSPVTVLDTAAAKPSGPKM